MTEKLVLKIDKAHFIVKLHEDTLEVDLKEGVMKLHHIILFLLLKCVFLSGLSAQSIKKAEKKMLYFEYSRAIPILEKIIEKEKKGVKEATVLLADCYRLMNDIEKDVIKNGKNNERG